jgi:hypothetical protein
MLSEPTKRRRASSIADVVDIMTALERELPTSDGVWWFNHLYLRVTLAVRTAVTTTTFRDPAFLERLDVVFANLYFDALAVGDVDPGAAPPAWRPLFESRRQPDLLSIQFALAGMNAHINRDLPEGIVATYLATDGAPVPDSPRHDDFEKVNDLLEAVEAQVKVDFASRIVALVDAVGGDLDDVVAMWNVRAAREAAWTHAEVLWALQAKPRLRQAFFSRLDRFTGFAGRGLLLPVTPLAQRNVV